MTAHHRSPALTSVSGHPSSVSGAVADEWRDVSRHSSGNAPLTGGGGALTGPGLAPARSRRVQLGGLLGLTMLLYGWDLGASGNANDFYAAAVQAGTRSWKAFFFGSFDSANFITVDKPPLSLWPMELAGRIFGFNSWSMLLPQAIEGVLTVWLLYATVGRWFGHRAGLLAGGLLAITPVAVLMFRFNNPDAMMTLLIVLAAYCVTRAVESASTRWLLLAGGVMGLCFLAKGLQPFTVVPALALAYLVAAPTPLRRRLWQLLAAGLALVVGAGWWVLAVDLTPVTDRPYIGGSGNNTALGLAFGYNGLDRLSSGSGGGPGGFGGGGFSGAAGIGRLFNSLDGGQIAWLLPASLVALVGVAALRGRRARTDRTTAALVLWGGWLLVTGAVLSFATGVIHTYYTIELAPAIAALVAVGAAVFWRHRDRAGARVGATLAVLATGVWGYALLNRTPDFTPWLRYGLVVAAGIAAAWLLLPPGRAGRGLVLATAVLGVGVLGAGSAAYALDTAGTAHTGSIPSAGPASAAGVGFPGGRVGGPGAFVPPGATGAHRFGPPSGTGFAGRPGIGGGARRPGGSASANSALSSLLDKTDTTWAAATVGSQSAAPLELATGKAVMAIGGFSGRDADPTLAQFRQLVREGRIAYFIGGGGRGGPGGGPGGGTGSVIESWVAPHYPATTVGGTTVYDLTTSS